MWRARPGNLLIWCALLLAGCSIQTLAVNKVGDALTEGGTTFAADDDPELVGDALPFTLKLMESLLAASPKHEGLTVALASGFTQYSWGWVGQRGEELREVDYDEAAFELDRARRLYLRARDYGLRALEGRHPRFVAALREDPRTAVAVTGRRDVPAMYWTAAAWALAVSLSKDRPETVAELPMVEALIDRAYALDPDWNDGAIHALLISYEPNRASSGSEGVARARRHFDRAVALSGGGLASPFVSLAESVAVPAQDREEFESLLRRALDVDADGRPEWRLQNILAQRRAAWLLSRADDLFLEPAPIQ